MNIHLLEKVKSENLTVGIIGMGYVGLPLALLFSLNDIKLIGF